MNDYYQVRKQDMERRYKTTRLLGVISIVIPIILLVVVPLVRLAISG